MLEGFYFFNFLVSHFLPSSGEHIFGSITVVLHQMMCFSGDLIVSLGIDFLGSHLKS